MFVQIPIENISKSYVGSLTTKKMFACLFFILMNFGRSAGMTVRLDIGPVRGYVVHVGGHAVYAFRNIPYAKPPVVDLRFQPPSEHDGWSSEDDLQQRSKVLCPQNAFYEDEIRPDAILGQEDCLVMDIYVRKNHEVENSSRPVLVYFHGGQFSRGSKEDYGPDFLLRYNDIILVVPNYRLGILGFFSAQDSILPGNLGLWDQNAALRWVAKNINQFGGDPKRVTIAGHEAGAASVGLHILASTSHDYFQRAISASGTALSPWLMGNNSCASDPNAVIEALGCSRANQSELLTCLNGVPLEKILELQAQDKKFTFLPRVDSVAEKPFIPFPPKSMYQRGYEKYVNYLVGTTHREAASEVSREFPKVLKFQHLDKMIQHFLRPHYGHSSNFEIIANAAKYHYFRRLMIPTFESIEPHIARLMTDFLYKSPVDQVVRLHQQKTGNIFVYVFNSKMETSCGSESRRCFGNEFYLFNTTSHQNKMFWINSSIRKVIKTVSKVWGNFIALGYPDAHMRWKPCRDVHEMHYAELSDFIQPKIRRHASDDTEFWITLVSELESAVNATEEYPEEQQLTSEYPVLGTRGVAALAIIFGVLCIALTGVVVITKKRPMSSWPVSSPKDVTSFANN